MIRIFGAGLIVLGCGGWGFYMAKCCKKEKSQLARLLDMLLAMKNELSCRHTPLPQIFYQLSGSDELGRIMAAMAEELEKSTSMDASFCMEAVLQKHEISKDCKELLSRLGNSLGSFDLEGQLRQLDAVIQEGQRRLQTHTDELQKRVKNYQTLGLCAGAALAILLL